MESLVDSGRCRAIGVSDIGLSELAALYEAARIKPAVVQVEAHPYLPETELLEFCKQKRIVLLAFAPLGHGIRPGPLQDPVVAEIAARVGQTPAQVLLAWAAQRGTVSDHHQDRGPCARELQHRAASARRARCNRSNSDPTAV